MTDKLREAAQQALYALELNCSSQTESPATKAIHALRAALAQQDAQAVEPLTDAQKDELWYRAYSDESRRAAFVWYFKGIADAERAHGIEALKGKQ